MYLRHFALTRLPFETPAHTDELFDSNSRREAETRLNHLIELRGIGLLTGEVGSGKTTVCRHVTTVLHPALPGAIILRTNLAMTPLICASPPVSGKFCS